MFHDKIIFKSSDHISINQQNNKIKYTIKYLKCFTFFNQNLLVQYFIAMQIIFITLYKVYKVIVWEHLEKEYKHWRPVVGHMLPPHTCTAMIKITQTLWQQEKHGLFQQSSLGCLMLAIKTLISQWSSFLEIN